MSDEDRIPEDHPIHEIWELNKKRRSLEGRLDLARQGDRDEGPAPRSVADTDRAVMIAHDPPRNG